MGLLLVIAVTGGAPARAAATEATQPPTGGETLEDAVYDPFKGIDRNGRIPKVELPDDLLHPERWRYIPEGRIKPGNYFRRLLVSSFAAPFVFRDGDVGTGFGLAITDIDFRLKRRREFLGAFVSYTTEGQQAYSATWRRWLKHREIPTGGVIQEERSFVRARAGYRKTLTRRFFGLGSGTRERDETSYTDEVFALSVGSSHSLSPPLDDLVLELAVDLEFHELTGGRVGGRPTTEQVHPELFRAAETMNLLRTSAEIRWDGRDSTRNPYDGFELGANVQAALAQTGGEAGAVFRLFASRVFRVPGLFHDGGDDQEEHPPTDAVAFGFFTESTAGELPFFLLPTLGGTRTLRGYIDGRWRDRASWHASSEYRIWVIPRGIPITRTIRIERIGLAAFYEIGGVADDSFALFDARPAMSYGIGGRLSLERAALFRLDVGFSEDGFNVSAGFGVPF